MRAGLLSVMLILGVVLAGGLLAWPAILWHMPHNGSSQRRIARVYCEEYYHAAVARRRDRAEPVSLQALSRPLYPEDPNIIYLLGDPWGSSYRLEAGTLRVWSSGPDREPGTEDDICCPPLED